jgi:hypothetical protein
LVGAWGKKEQDGTEQSKWFIHIHNQEKKEAAMPVVKIPMAGAHNICTNPCSVREGKKNKTERSNQNGSFTFPTKRKRRPPCP